MFKRLGFRKLAPEKCTFTTQALQKISDLATAFPHILRV
jgi:hypothetical protein